MEKIIILTGAGISQESGLDTFRDANGIWAKYCMEEVCTPEGFKKDPQKLHGFYNHLRRGLPAIMPNDAHKALVRLEHAIRNKEIDAELLIITQNIDDLHERAGSQNVIYMHGELNKLWCCHCNRRFEWHVDCHPDTSCPYCSYKTLRPDIVWFGEMPYRMAEIDKALDACTLFVAIGTSGVVYPAAGFIDRVRGRARTVELNLETSIKACVFDESHEGKATVLVPEFIDHLLINHQKR